MFTHIFSAAIASDKLTFPSGLPLFSLDRIYARAPLATRRAWTDPDARRASDHLPLIADLGLARP